MKLATLELRPPRKLRSRDEFVEKFCQTMIGIVFILALGSLLVGCGVGDFDEVATLRQFEKKKPEFNVLLQMFRDDSRAQRIAMDWMKPEGELSPQRHDEYRKLFAATGVWEGIEGFARKQPYHFICTSKGLLMAGHSAGIAYSEQKLDTASFKLEIKKLKRGIYYKHIEGGWYLFLDKR